MAGRILAIARRERHRAPMELLDAVQVTVDGGVEGDARGALAGRQVSVLSRESWEAACADLGRELPWTTRRANLLIEGVSLAGAEGGTLRIGDLALRIAEETSPCSRMEQQAAGLKAALAPDWRGGALCIVTSGGAIAVGDAVQLVDAAAGEASGQAHS